MGKGVRRALLALGQTEARQAVTMSDAYYESSTKAKDKFNSRK